MSLAVKLSIENIEKVFFEKLQHSIGIKNVESFQKFIENLNSELNIISKLGRGKKLSLNLKSYNDTYNFGSIQEDGEVWFYGIITKTEELGDKNIGINYLKKLAELVNGELYAREPGTATARDIILTGNLYLTSSGTFDPYQGEFTFRSSSSQTVTAQNDMSFYDLTINNDGDSTKIWFKAINLENSL